MALATVAYSDSALAAGVLTPFRGESSKERRASRCSLLGEYMHGVTALLAALVSAC